MKTFKVWQNAWKSDVTEPITISFPSDWEVEYHKMAGDCWPALTKKQIREKILHPIASKTIQELASEGKEAAIVFDDISRGTQVKPIAEIVLEELQAGGIEKKHIRFLCALGNHGAHNRSDFVHKLGEKIVEEYPVFNHNPFEHCVKIGVDSAGVPVEINEEFMNCDVRVGIGSVTPHPMNGYGGGGKLLFPGLASIKTTCGNHLRRQFEPVGKKEMCGLRIEIERMTRMAGQFFKIDALINSKLDTIGLFAGDPIEEYYAAVEQASIANAMNIGASKDLVVVNANAKYNESNIAVTIAHMELKPGGDIVMINHCAAGQVVHYLYGPFGMNYGGSGWLPVEMRGKMPCRRLIIYTPYPEYVTRLAYPEPEKVFFARTWQEVLNLLSGHTKGTTVSVLSDGTISYFPSLLKR